jgi:hypothetical protein
MKTTSRIIRIWAVIFTAMCFVAGCSDNDTPAVIDPAGTVELLMERTGLPPSLHTSINGIIYISYAMDFCGGANPARFINIGKVNGLGDIREIPISGWSLSVPVEPGCGYIAYYEGIYYRMYVVDYQYEPEGVKVKYQFPFELTTLSLSMEAISFTNYYNSQTVEVTTNAADCYLSCNEPWIRLERYKGNTITVFVDENTDTESRKGEVVIRANERVARIVVTQEGTPAP